MAQIVLDFGSGNSCKNDIAYVKRMYDEFKKIDTGKHSVVIKWQLFKQAGQNIPLNRGVFDLESLRFLLQYKVPFIKLANNRKLDYLIGEIPRSIHVYISCGSIEELSSIKLLENVTPLLCVSDYPATVESYENTYRAYLSNYGISDHTTDFNLWEIYQPKIIEWHVKLQDTTGLDAGEFSRTPEQLKRVM